MNRTTLRHGKAVKRPFEAGDPVAVLLHGRGSDLHDLLGLRPGLPDAVALVTPQAPFPGAPWGYGPGWAWYRYVAEDRVEPETLERSLSDLDGFLQALPGILGAEPGPLLLGGFSQGGTTSLAYGLTRPGAVAAVANFSGFLVHHVDPPTTGDVPPVFWGHGVADPAIPFELARTGRARLRRAGVHVEARDYRMGHWIAPDELRDFVAWLDGRVP